MTDRVHGSPSLASGKAAAAPRRGRPPIPDLRDKIFACATELFSQKGFAEVTADEVAARAQVGKGSVYRQFGSKERLYATVVIAEFRGLRLKIEESLKAEETAQQKLVTVVTQLSKYFWDKGEFFTLLRDPRALPSRQLEDFRRERGQFSAMLTKVLREGAAEGTLRRDLGFETVAEAILGMIRGLRRHRRPGQTVEDAIGAVLNLALDGLVVAAPRARSSYAGRVRAETR